MEHNDKTSRAGLLAASGAIALGCALAGLLLCTFLICSTFVEQFLPLILLGGFFLLTFFVMRMRWARAHVRLFYTVCVVIAITCLFVIRAVF